MVKALLIDPKEKTITPVELEKYSDMYPLLGCDGYDLVRAAKDVDIFVDGEGMLNDPEYFFRIAGYPDPLAGKGIVVGNDGVDDWSDVTVSAEVLKELVTFERHKVLGFDVTEGETTLLGKPAHMIQTKVVLGDPGPEKED